MNLGALLDIKNKLNRFRSNHPKLEEEGKKVLSKGFCEGQEIAIAVRYPDGTEIKTGIRVTESDLPFFESLKDLIS